MNNPIAARKPTEIVLGDQMPRTSAALLPPPTRIGRPIMFLMLLSVGLWGGLGSWAALAPIQSAVVASGSFRVEGDLPVVQHLEGGLLREVRVREGDQVEKGQVLAVLADTVSASQDRILNNQLVGALAREQRLAAEFRGDTDLVFSDELLGLVEMEASFAGLLQAQRELFVSNGEMSKGQTEILRDRIAEQKQQLVGLRARQETLGSRLAIVQDQLKDMLALYDKGLITKIRMSGQRETEVAMLGEITFIEAQIAGVGERISETRQRVLQVHRDRQRRISEQRQQVKEVIFDVRQRIIANQDVSERRFVRAPQAGRVIDLQFTSAGEVIRSGQEIMTIVPRDATYIVEGQLRPEDVDQVAEGSKARVRLTAYNFRTTPPVLGDVIHVSADSFTEEQTGRQFYKVYVRIPETELASLPQVEVLPGMPAQVMITTGEQTVATYILGPILAGLDLAMREGD